MQKNNAARAAFFCGCLERPGRFMHAFIYCWILLNVGAYFSWRTSIVETSVSAHFVLMIPQIFWFILGYIFLYYSWILCGLWVFESLFDKNFIFTKKYISTCFCCFYHFDIDLTITFDKAIRRHLIFIIHFLFLWFFHLKQNSCFKSVNVMIQCLLAWTLWFLLCQNSCVVGRVNLKQCVVRVARSGHRRVFFM